tara:strand:+ start:524 stop:949 length:426 start_codon:yes stop_codon:yes gene_type:complete
MSETQKFESMNAEDRSRIEAMRKWVSDHYEDSTAYATVSGKLKLIQTILDNGWVSPEETLKLQSLGVAFGDALEQEVAELNWVVVNDEYGRDPALRWGSTSVIAFPQTAISKRIEDGEYIDVFEMFGGFQKALIESVHEAT